MEHWFRQDNCFTVPSPDKWFELKELLNIKTDEFDLSIVSFEEKEGVFEKAERVYITDYISPCLLVGDAPTIIERRIDMQEEWLGNVYSDKAGRGFAGNVWDKEKVSPTLTTMQGGGRQPMVVDNGFYNQAIETMIKEDAQEGDIVDAFNQKIIKNGISPTITTRPEGKKTAILPVVNKYRIRKLTPKECWRLMGYTDEDYEKAASINSNTQLYKQAGNAIVKQVLMAIFSQMGIKGVPKWNETKEVIEDA